MVLVRSGCCGDPSPPPPPLVATATVGGEGEDGFTKVVSRRRRAAAVLAGNAVIAVRVNPVGTTNPSGTRKEVARPGNGERERCRRQGGQNGVGVLSNASHSDIERGVLEIRPETNPGLIKIEDMQAGRGGLGEVTVVALTALGCAAVEKEKIIVGFSSARVLALRPKPLKCHRCLARGHVAASCPSTKTRAGACFICGEPGNMARTRKNKDLLAQRMVETGPGLAIVAEPWLVPPGDGKWFPSLGGTPLAAVLIVSVAFAVAEAVAMSDALSVAVAVAVAVAFTVAVA
ncbi:hypothetical protein M0804_004168 [Polistes exclamans]|nr:hypothetical protein M0804_004168 [Polistes exclamans]